jgi:hypothetical protein
MTAHCTVRAWLTHTNTHTHTNALHTHDTQIHCTHMTHTHKYTAHTHTLTQIHCTHMTHTHTQTVPIWREISFSRDKRAVSFWMRREQKMWDVLFLI